MNAGPERPEIYFRAFEYGEAHESLLVAMRASAQAEMPDHPDMIPPPGPELEPANRGAYLVAYANRRPAASGGYRTYPDDATGETAEIVRVYVNPGARGSGVGRALINELEEAARDDEYRRVVMHLSDNQPAAKALYEILGYRPVPGVSPDVGPGGRLTFAKDLTD